MLYLNLYFPGVLFSSSRLLTPFFLFSSLLFYPFLPLWVCMTSDAFATPAPATEASAAAAEGGAAATSTQAATAGAGG